MNIDFVLWILLLWPIFSFFVLAILAMLPREGLYKLQKKIIKFIGENRCNSQFCKKFKQVRQNAWKMAKHPKTILLLLKRLCFQMKEKHSRKMIVDTEEIFTIEGIIHEVKHETYKYNRTIYFIIMLYYSSVFTAAFWPRFVYLCECFDFIGGFDFRFYIWGYEKNFWLYIWVYLAFFIPFCFNFMGISPENHLTVAETAKYLTGSPECQCYVKVHCYHTWGSGDDATKVTVTTFQTDIEVPVARWIDRGNINMAEINFDLNKMLAKKNVLQLSPVLKITPADDETEKQLKEFRENCIASHKHRDTYISATVISKMMRHGKKVDDLVVFKEGTAVPKQWLSKGGLWLLYLFFALGTPLAAVVFLYWKMNTRNMKIKKQIVMNHIGV